MTLALSEVLVLLEFATALVVWTVLAGAEATLAEARTVGRTAEGARKTALQGLIQICAGLHKRAKGQNAGAEYLLGRGLEKAMRTADALPNGAVAPFTQAALSAR